MNGVIEQENVTLPAMQMAEPLHIQRLEAALDMRPFMQQAREILSRPLTSPEESEADDSPGEESYDDESAMGGSRKKKSKKLGTKQGELQGKYFQ